jgi:hypothetical protein
MSEANRGGGGPAGFARGAGRSPVRSTGVPGAAAAAIAALAAGWLAAGCGSAAAPAPREPAPAAPVSNVVAPVPVEDTTHACKEAAVGLERGTRSLRPPEDSVLELVRALCVDDAWPVATVECFAQMDEGDFGRCTGALPERARKRLLNRVGGGGDGVTVASALVKLSTLQVGIPECDQFVAAVAHVLVCEAMALDVRAQLGAETADFWSLPTSGLPADAQLRMADVCGRSTAALEQQAAGAGCAP